MITFASERGLGQDLATHLLNEQDNERMELADIRGSVAQDLHGAMTEWEFQAHALTRSKNYLFSMSVNPWDAVNGPLTREQYFDFIDRAEERLGLSGQPRAVVFHTKEGREHCHVVWSRTDPENQSAVHLPFFKNALMMVTKEFARDHDLKLPRGYEKYRDDKNKQLSFYEAHQQRAGGLSKDEHREQVTDAWRQSDSPKAFVQALADRGYILATGKRPYVLIDLFGHMNALPKLIDDRTVRTKDIRAFLERDYPADTLPSVDEARAVTAKHFKSMEGFREHERKAEELAELKARQVFRRTKLDNQQTNMRQRQQAQQKQLTDKHQAGRNTHRALHVAETRRIRIARYQRQPQGLAAFLGRISGVTFLREKLHQYQDYKCHEAFLKERELLAEQQAQQHRDLQARHAMQALNMQRQIRTLDKIDRYERQSLDRSLSAEARSDTRGGRAQMLALSLEPEQTLKSRQRVQLSKQMAKAASPKKIDLGEEFSRAAEGEQGEGDAGTTEGAQPKRQPKADREQRQKKHRNRDRDKDKDRGR